MSVLGGVDPHLVRQTQGALDDFASDGLRTLVLGYKKMSESDWSEWWKKYHEASTSMEDRDELIAKCHEDLEQNLLLAGVTAIEDKLQDGVPEAIKHILEGQIKLWVLTGDKLETAMNIGYSLGSVNFSSKNNFSNLTLFHLIFDTTFLKIQISVKTRTFFQNFFYFDQKFYI